MRFAALAALLLLPLPATAGEDWPQWRGPNRDGISLETGLRASWPDGGPPLVFRADGLGAGYSTVAVADGRIHTQGMFSGREWIITLDAATGAQLWATPHADAYRDGRGDGPRGVPTVVDGTVYALGARGNSPPSTPPAGRSSGPSTSSSASAGETSVGASANRRSCSTTGCWSRPAAGRSGSPPSTGSPANSCGGPPATRRATPHRCRWTSRARRTSSISAASAPPASARTTGPALELPPRLEPDGQHRDAGLVSNRGGTAEVFLSSDYGTGGALLELQADGAGGVTASEKYFTRNMRAHHMTPVLHEGVLYGFSGSIFSAVDIETGALFWRDRSIRKGSLTFADNRLYVFSERGDVALVEPSRAGYRQHGRFELRQRDRSGENTWSHPVVANGLLYLRDQDVLVAYDVRDR